MGEAKILLFAQLKDEHFKRKNFIDGKTMVPH